jgi:F0F1-type ATP synthase membrane subunit b/b'
MLIVSFVLLMVIIFVSMIFFLRKILNRNVISATAHLEQLTAEYTKKEDQVRKQLQEAKLKSQEIITNAEREAKKEQEDILTKAREESEHILNEARKKAEEIVSQADRTRQTLIAEINQKIEHRALERAAELIQQALPEQIREEIHHRWLDELVSSSFEQLERLHVPEGDLQARVVTAFSLTTKQRDALKAKIKQKLGREVKLKEELDSSVIAGLIVNIGSLVLDGSLRFKIQEVTSAKQSGNS